MNQEPGINEINQPALNYCAECNERIKGRSDKKFCNDFCRNTFNNKVNAPENQIVRNTNHMLQRNRRILKELLHNKKSVLLSGRQPLFNQGFQFGYCTQTILSKKETLVFYCYEFAYQVNVNGRVKIMEQNKSQ